MGALKKAFGHFLYFTEVAYCLQPSIVLAVGKYSQGFWRMEMNKNKKNHKEKVIYMKINKDIYMTYILYLQDWNQMRKNTQK